MVSAPYLTALGGFWLLFEKKWYSVRISSIVERQCKYVILMDLYFFSLLKTLMWNIQNKGPLLTRTLKNVGSENPGPWKTWTLKNLDQKTPGTRKTWTLKNLDPEKPGPLKTWILKTWSKYGIKNMSDLRELCFMKIMRYVNCCLKVHVLAAI